MSGAHSGPLSAEEARRLGPVCAALARDAYDRLQAGLERLPDKPEETTLSAFRALWHLAAGHRVSASLSLRRPLTALDAEQRRRVVQLVEQRLTGRPLAHITERQEFMELEMLAGPEALIPRRETEILARAAVDVAGRIADEHGTVRVMDVCTGAGNVAAAVAVAEPRATVFACDLSDSAVALAERNFRHFGVSGRVSARSGDLFEPFDTPDHVGLVHLVTCNPPYISSGRAAAMPGEIALHEPRLAFDGGPLGVRVLHRLVRETPRMLRPGGWLALEVGVGQGRSVTRRMTQSGAYARVDALTDDRGEVRVVLAQTLTDRASDG